MLPPKPPLNERSDSVSIIQAKPATIKQVDRQHDERPPAAHPAAELLDADRGDARAHVAQRAEAAVGRRGDGAHATAPAPTGSCAVTWRNSSSRSLAARENVATRRSARTAAASSARGALVVAVEPDLDRRRPRAICAVTTLCWCANHACAATTARLVAEDADAVNRPDPQPALDVGDPALGEDLAAVDDRHRRAQLLELGKDVGRDEDRLAQRPQLAQQLAQLDAGPRVEARRRLVEQQHARVVDQRVREAQPLLHAARQALHVGVALGAEVHEVEQVADHPPPAVGRDAVAAGEEVQVLPDLHVVVDPERVRHEAEDATDVVGVPAHARTRRSRRPRVGHEQRRQDPQRRGLAGAVGADQAEDLALADVEVEAGDGERAVVALDEPRGVDDRAHLTVPVIWTWNWKPMPSWLSLTNFTWTCPVAGLTQRAAFSSS